MNKEYKKYYTYRHRRLDTNEVFYVGIATKGEKTHRSIRKIYERAYAKTNRNNFWKNIINHVEYEVEIIAESNDYEKMKELEIFLISIYGRRDLGTGILCNLTNGGDGSVGWTPSQKQKDNFKLGKNPMAKKVLNIITGEIFSSAKEAHKNIEHTIKQRSFYSMLNGDIENKTEFEYVEKTKLNNGRRVIDTTTNEIFKSIKEAAIKNNILKDTLGGLLNNTYYNHTNLMYLEDYENNIYNKKQYPYVKVINTETKEIYLTLKEAAKKANICVASLHFKLNGEQFNNTPYQLLTDYEKGMAINWNFTKKVRATIEVINTETKEIYSSIKEISEKFSISKSAIRAYLADPLKSKVPIVHLKDYTEGMVIQNNPPIKRLIYDSLNNTYYRTITEVSKISKIPYTTLCQRLSGSMHNNTQYYYINDETIE